ncbi:monovalent cation/H(+) antiporter subunit G [Cyanobacterium aponinum]|uniref:Multisubunit sodium/proton antiporter, MrpG subunit n=1 Tax=Cyanobacterium aponinum (strain PCC 10605) TaxID=755178 RepID=K9Z6V5_CYAAP|nr:monovalent cation/H(+) antiporter subunit G [Cyanobacterium aponinum]AFZ54290.1 multisubunit sodium/proton antiporter, MrpG subunit [Cyanobacterium aponinum PCC 10605]
MDFLTYFFMVIGLVFWLWGTIQILDKRSVLYKLHSLSVADTLGSILIVFALALKIPSELPLLILAIISLTLWNTMLGYVLAYCSRNQEGKKLNG